MKRFGILCSCLLLWGCDGPGGNTTNPPGNNSDYIPFPNGYGYMENLGELQQATDKGDEQTIRDHAWKLWAGIMQPDTKTGWPLWTTWPNTSTAFNADPSDHVGGMRKKHSSKAAVVAKPSEPAATVSVFTPQPTYDLPTEVTKKYPGAITKSGSIKNGKYFIFNGDIMVPTESLSQQLMSNIRSEKLYLQSTLNALNDNNVHQLEVSPRSIVTKHMYWPVKAKGITGVPVWKNKLHGKPVSNSYPGYAGYEIWDTIVAIDPSGEKVGQTVPAEFLYGVKDHDGKKLLPTVKADAKVYGLKDFYYHKITPEDWKSFTDADKAILDAASYWANNQSIGVGDYLITIAMHVNTKELPSWTLQSVWWSDTPDAGQYAADRPSLPQAVGPWDHYLMTDSYAVPPNAKGELDIAVNPYIEGVIHPIATSCRNCHVRAGWPTASYQSPDCSGLLSYLTPESGCLKSLTLTDYMWIIPDRAIK